MFRNIFALVVQLVLSLRYRVTVRPHVAIVRKGKSGILFLANHPALIDPVIVMSRLFKPYHPRPLADEAQMNRPVLRHLFSLVRPVLIPDVKREGKSAGHRAEAAVLNVARALAEGDNILLYPSGHILRSPFENLGANSAVETILREVPDVTIALVRTTGLFGSAFSHASGKYPKLRSIFPKAIAALFLAGLFFMPRRKVTLEIVKPADFPQNGSRQEINRYLEAYFDQTAHPARYVPYSLFWKSKNPFGTTVDRDAASRGGAAQSQDEPQDSDLQGDIPRLIDNFLREQLKVNEIHPHQKLAEDLGMDSLLKMELAVWLETTFGVGPIHVEALQTVQDCRSAASGNTLGRAESSVFPDARWKVPSQRHGALHAPNGQTLAALFLEQAEARPRQPILADTLRGTLTYRKLLVAVFALKPHIERLEGSSVGILLPASTAAAVAWLAVMFAGKTPVMYNFTAGKRAVEHGIRVTGTQHILTSTLFLEKLKERGADYQGLGADLIALETLSKKISIPAKIGALLNAHVGIDRLRNAKISETAAVLFTSGSETVPKAVPLSHRNIIANLRGFSENLHLTENDRLLGILPPFHSFGLTGTVVMPLCMGLRTVFYPNPTESDRVAALIEKAKITTLLSTPTFLAGMLLQPADLSTLRLTFVGAEKCPTTVYERYAKKCPEAVLCEGYGITECSPVISMNRVESPVQGSIGRVLAGMTYAVVDDSLSCRVEDGATGILLVRGDNVFSGYLDSGVSSPFARFEDKEWYNTGDLVSETPDGILEFKGRKKRFIKMGGEMISLPAIEAALQSSAAFPDNAELAVSAVGETNPRLVLFATVPGSVEQINQSLRSAGLSALHRISEVVVMDELPKLGSGKINYRALAESAQAAA